MTPTPLKVLPKMSVDQALRLIPGRKQALDSLDNRLAHVIKYIEQTLITLNPGVPADITYHTEDGGYILGFHKHSGKWHITYGREADDNANHDCALLSASRQARSEVFMVYEGFAQSPIEQLIVAVAESLDGFASERHPLLDRAMHIASVLTAAGFPDEGGQ